jgi:hypothetical protein
MPSAATSIDYVTGKEQEISAGANERGNRRMQAAGCPQLSEAASGSYSPMLTFLGERQTGLL